MDWVTTSGNHSARLPKYVTTQRGLVEWVQRRLIERLQAENASLRDQLARETALRIAAEQRAEAMAW